MLGLKGIYAIIAVVIYSILIGLFIKFTANIFHDECHIESPCVRFCSIDESESDNDLKIKFNDSELGENIKDNFKVKRGEPNCREVLKERLPRGDTYEFTPWGAVYYERMYKADRYCIYHTDDMSNKSVNGWKLKTCEMDVIVHDGFHIFSIIVSVAVIGFTICVYGYYSELRDTHGKCLISLLLSLLLIYIFLPTTRFHRFVNDGGPWSVIFTVTMLTGFLLAFYWFTTLSFHIFWRLNNFKKNLEGKDKFTAYFLFIFGMTAISVTILILDIFSYHLNFQTQAIMLMLFAVIAFLVIYDLLLILSACFLLVKRSRSLENEEEEEKFKFEKKWFWMHAANLILMIITFPFEIFSWQEKIYLSQHTSVVVDLIKMFTAINLTIVFVLRSSVQAKLVKDYRQLKESLNVSISTMNLNFRNRNVPLPVVDEINYETL